MYFCELLAELVVVYVGVGRRGCVVEGVLEVDVAEGCVVELSSAGELHDVGLITCVGHAIVQADNAPDCGVAQGVIHGVPVRHGEKQEEEEGEVEKEVERDKEEENNQTPVRMSMDGMEVTRHCEALEPM